MALSLPTLVEGPHKKYAFNRPLFHEEVYGLPPKNLSDDPANDPAKTVTILGEVSRGTYSRADLYGNILSFRTNHDVKRTIHFNVSNSYVGVNIDVLNSGLLIGDAWTPTIDVSYAPSTPMSTVVDAINNHFILGEWLTVELLDSNSWHVDRLSPVTESELIGIEGTRYRITLSTISYLDRCYAFNPMNEQPRVLFILSALDQVENGPVFSKYFRNVGLGYDYYHSGIVTDDPQVGGPYNQRALNESEEDRWERYLDYVDVASDLEDQIGSQAIVNLYYAEFPSYLMFGGIDYAFSGSYGPLEYDSGSFEIIADSMTTGDYDTSIASTMPVTIVWVRTGLFTLIPNHPDRDAEMIAYEALILSIINEMSKYSDLRIFMYLDVGPPKLGERTYSAYLGFDTDPKGFAGQVGGLSIPDTFPTVYSNSDALDLKYWEHHGSQLLIGSLETVRPVNVFSTDLAAVRASCERLAAASKNILYKGEISSASSLDVSDLASDLKTRYNV